MTATYPIRETQGVKILELPKRLTGIEGGEELETALEEMLAAGEKQVILDFSRVAYVDTFVLGSLIREHIRFIDRGAHVKILKPAGKIKDVLVVTKLITVFDCFEDEAVAVASF
jgi:anti-sigma B factor antagonist